MIPTARSFSEFSLRQVEQQFALKIVAGSLFAEVKSMRAEEWLERILQKGAPAAGQTEKSRSEFIVAPILLQAQAMAGEVGIYSGVALDVDPAQGLRGVCDFALTKTAQLPELRAPICVLVEAKKNDIESGFGQCVAEMVAADMLNTQDQSPQPRIYGCVTNGIEWQFLCLEGKQITFDTERRFLQPVDRLLGIFVHILS